MKFVLCVFITFSSFCFAEELKVGIIGLDTSHVTAFTEILNNKNNPKHVPGAKVVAAFKGGSDDIKSSYTRLEKFTGILQDKYGVKIYPAIEELCRNVDVILLESVDGRKHLEQAEKVFKAGKRVFIDKPLAGNLKQCIEIYKLGKKHNAEWFSSSSLRYHEKMPKIKEGKLGKVYSIISQGPINIEPTHTELFWYGVHATEALFTIMERGCEEVSRVQTDSTEVAVGKWKDGRIGTVLGHKKGKARYKYSLTINGEKGNSVEGIGSDYARMLVDVVKFFKTGTVPVSPEETLEIMAFMEAADESKKLGGKAVKLADVMKLNGWSDK